MTLAQKFYKISGKILTTCDKSNASLSDQLQTIKIINFRDDSCLGLFLTTRSRFFEKLTLRRKFK